jgi:hypothetical protein
VMTQRQQLYDAQGRPVTFASSPTIMQQQGGFYQAIPQQQMQPQPQAYMSPMAQAFVGGGQQYVTPSPIVYQPPAPTAPTTIVIDTGPRAMEEAGFQDDMQAAARGMPVMGMSSSSVRGGGMRRVTPRARPGSPRRGPAMVGGMEPSVAANAKNITIKKLS